MIRNRVSWGFGLMALLVLTFGMAACGGSEPAPVVQPPAPPPAPPPFQPQAVEVALGEAGGNITLMTTESGGFTLNGELFESGGSVVAENGNTYLLILADGNWNAAYQAAEIMVTLGITEETVSLTRAEDGTYWLGDAAVQSGVTMATATNGNVYTLMITTDDAGMIAWQATYVEPVVNVMLGLSGDIVMIKKSEDGSYWLGDMTVTSGETMATAANGNTYTLMMADGEWSAAYVAMTGMVTIGGTGLAIDATRDEAGSWTAVHPLTGETITLTEGGMVMAGDNQYMLSSDGAGNWMASYVAYEAPVMLGSSGTITLVRAEDGTYWHGDALVENGSMVTAMNGNEYELMMDDAGMWSATYVSYEAIVMLGASGTTIALVRAEDGTYWHGDALVENGSKATAVNGNTYTLMMGEDGMWMAAYDDSDRIQTVSLGSSGSSVTVTQEENGTYSYTMDDGESMTLTSGMEVEAENGNTYTLELADGAWSSDYVAEVMEIMGTGGLMAKSLEAEAGYDTDGDGAADLDESGTGDVTVDDAMYRVSMEDGELTGLRFDAAIHGDTDHYIVGDVVKIPAQIGDDEDTSANEEDTKLTIAGGNFAYSDLLSTGTATGMGDNIVEEATKDIEDLRADAEALLGIFDDGDSTLRSQLTRLWGSAQTAVNDVFGAGKVKLGVRPDEDDILDEFGDLIAALSGLDNFTAATEEDGDGVFEDAELDAAEAAEAFEAALSETTVTFGVTGDTRYGAVYKKERDIATDDLAYKFFLPSVLVDAADNPYTEISLNENSVTATPDTGTTVVEGSAIDGDHIKITAEGSGEAIEQAVANAVLNRAALPDGTDLDKADFSATGTYELDDGTYSVQIYYDANPDDDADQLQTVGNPIVVALVEVYDKPTTSTGKGEAGAFAYGTIDDTVRTRNIQSTGNAYYRGGTEAVSGDGTFYSGDIEVRVRFVNSRVSGLVTNLESTDGDPWEFSFGDVNSIILPEATLASNATWTGDAGNEAEITFAARAGSPRPAMEKATFQGMLLGKEDDAGSQAIGTWSVGDDPSDGSRYLAGGFGAERVSDEPDVRPGTDSGAGTETSVSSRAGVKLEDGLLKITVNRYGWNHLTLDDSNTPDISTDDRLSGNRRRGG